MIKPWKRQRNTKCRIPTFSLIPVDSSENLDYVRLLNQIIQDKCHNIALLGGYGAGKSSILQSFVAGKTIKDRNKIKYISCLPYAILNNDSIKNITSDDSKCDTGIKLQEEILKQIIFGEKSDRLPKLKYSRTTKGLSKTTTALNMIISACVTLLIVILLGCAQYYSELVCATIAGVIFLLLYCIV